ncbi:MAG: response regulator [Halobacteriales archaeon]
MGDPTETTVLVADDEAELVELYAAFLGEYDVRVATSGEAALSKVGPDVDVVLLDRRMPDLSGDEVLETLRERGLDCQVAMLTAVEPAQDIVEMPFDDYETKPIDRSDLLGLVEVLVERAGYNERSQEYFTLASKKAALEVAGNDDTEEYRELVERLDALRDEIDATLDTLAASERFGEPRAD